MRHTLLIIFLFLVAESVCGQSNTQAPGAEYVTPRDRTAPLDELVRELRPIAENVLRHADVGYKIQQNQELSARLIAILARLDSYDYAFDSLTTISRLAPEDDAFRIFTWMFVDPSDNHLYYGIVQRRVTLPNGTSTIKVIPLYDRIDKTADVEQLELTDQRWLGALYYQPRNTKFGVLTYKGTLYRPNYNTERVEKQPATYYVVLGLNEHTVGSNYKVMEVIHFKADSLDRVYFGLPIFYGSAVPVHRRVFKYSDNAVFSLNVQWVVEKSLMGKRKELMVVFDHINAPNMATDADPSEYWDYGPDGSLNAFRWVDKVYEQRKGFFGLVKNVRVYDPSLEKYDPKQTRKRQKEEQARLRQQGIVVGSR
jgi:hypothetical protein